MHYRPEEFAVSAIRKQGCRQIGRPYGVAGCLFTAAAPVITMTRRTIASKSCSAPRDCDRRIGRGRAQKTRLIGILKKQFRSWWLEKYQTGKCHNNNRLPPPFGQKQTADTDQ